MEDANWKNELRSKDNLALGYLTSCARQAGYTVKILHAEHNKYTPTDIQNLIQKYSPKAIGISLTAQRAYPVVKEYVQKIKEVSSSPIYLGGIFPSIAYELILKECNGIDAICLGEGEVFIVDYLNAIIKGEGNYRDISGIAYKDEYSNVCVNGEKNVIENLDELRKLLEDKLNIDGLTLIQNNGDVQEVKHYHLHLKPYYNEKLEKMNIEDVYKKITE